MSFNQSKRVALLFSAVVLCFSLVTVGVADEITLQNGAVLRGKVSNAGKNYAVTTAQGIRVVVERASVQKLDRTLSTPSPAALKLTSAEKAWLSKIRRLIARIESSEGESRRHALADLRSINDPAAIPALMLTLRTSDDDASRLLYVRILGDMPGSKAVVGLVEEALFDSSEPVRQTAQEASKKLRPEYVRSFYGQALRFPNREIVTRAADVLITVGNKENVPYLIDSLYSPTVDTVYRPSCCMTRVTYLANAHGGGTYVATRDHVRPVLVVRNRPNPPVKDALEAITKQSFGYDRAAWKRWWASEQLADNSKGR